MCERATKIASFLKSSGWQAASRTPLAGDASARRYDRLAQISAPFSAVLMDAPPESGEDTAPFLNIAAYLSKTGFSAPEIYAEDAPNGLILMEDLGDDLYSRVCEKTPAVEHLLYSTAVDALAELHRQPLPDGLLHYSEDIYVRESELVTDWYIPAITGQKTPTDIQSEYGALIRLTCNQLQNDQSVCVLRDYHAENLLWLPKRSGIARVGQLDFQDALLGHRAYDLVSLLEDARRDTSRDLQQAMFTHYLDQTGLSHDTFARDYACLGAQRNLKIIGIFARLCRRDLKPDYVDLIPRVWAHLMHDLSHPSLVGLKEFVTRYIPAPTEGILAQIKKGGA
ncbi:MAG: aminoglycoside/choline kinase family phosphotransferase [Paracoccaceae bacterium]|jgi:aminoglycoside/choline kinase family phosphotransferase